MFELIVDHFLGNVPTWIFPFMAGAGFAVYIISGIAQHIEPIRIYGLVARPISIVVMVVGVFLYGGAGVIAVQQQALLEAQHKVELAEQASADAAKQLADNLANQEHLVKGRNYGVGQIIAKDKSKIDRDCARLNDDAWEDYNRAVANLGSKILGPKK